MEHIDIIIIAGISFLLVTGGLFIGMYFARRTEAERAAKLEEREERVLRMRAKLEHDRFSVSAEGADGDVVLDEDLFKGLKEELEQERMELDMRREELELDIRMLEEENDRLKSRLTGSGSDIPPLVSDADDATIVEEPAAERSADIEDAVFADADSEDANGDEPEIDVESATAEDSDIDDTVEIDPETADSDVVTDTSDDERLRNTIFGDFFFDDAATPDEPDPLDDGWSSEPDEPETSSLDVELPESVGGDGASLTSRPEAASNPADSEARSTPGEPAFDHMLTADGDFQADGSIEQVLGLSRSDLALMNDLGYGTFRSIADLGDDEITRLAEAFDIPERTIRQQWIPDSRMRAAREPRS